MADLSSSRNNLKKLRDKFLKEEQSLLELYDVQAIKICPFNIGDEIEYEPGKKGLVEKIYFPRTPWILLEEQDPEYWAVIGRKINKTGEIGKKDYQEVNNKDFNIIANSCRRKTLTEILGIKE